MSAVRRAPERERRSDIERIADFGRTFVERMRLFEPSGLVALCTEAGPQVDAARGDFARASHDPASPRTIPFAPRQ
jgi:hypothetical protein